MSVCVVLLQQYLRECVEEEKHSKVSIYKKVYCIKNLLVVVVVVVVVVVIWPCVVRVVR